MDERISDKDLEDRHPECNCSVCLMRREIKAFRQREASARLAAEELVEKIRKMDDYGDGGIFSRPDHSLSRSEAVALLAEHLGKGVVK